MRIRFTLLAVIAVAAGTACRDSAPDVVPGEYVLKQIGIHNLPVTILADSTVSVAVSAGSITLLADSTFIDARTYVVAPAGAASTTERDTVTGSFSLAGDKINLSASGGVQYQMVWQGRLLTRYAEGFTYRYIK